MPLTPELLAGVDADLGVVLVGTVVPTAADLLAVAGARPGTAVADRLGRWVAAHGCG